MSPSQYNFYWNPELHVAYPSCSKWNPKNFHSAIRLDESSSICFTVENFRVAIKKEKESMASICDPRTKKEDAVLQKKKNSI
jgi:hypothetical protein